MSMRSDAGVCRYCGAVLQLAALTKIIGATGVDAYSCADCAGTQKGGRGS